MSAAEGTHRDLLSRRDLVAYHYQHCTDLIAAADSKLATLAALIADGNAYCQSEYDIWYETQNDFMCSIWDGIHARLDLNGTGIPATVPEIQQYDAYYSALEGVELLIDDAVEAYDLFMVVHGQQTTAAINETETAVTTLEGGCDC